MSGRQRQNTADIVHTHTAELLRELLKTIPLEWPLPHPPLVDASLPPMIPDTPDQVIRQAEGLFISDRATFQQLLDQCREGIVPHRLSLSVDPQREGEKWLLKRIDEAARIILFGFCERWLAAALDREVPDAARWFVGIALFIGLCREGGGLAENRGYHILESIAMTSPPGRWPTRPASGRHQLDWNPSAVREVRLVDDTTGIDAAHWVMDSLEMGGAERQRLLVKWMRSMLERPRLVDEMALPQRFGRLVNGPEDAVAAELAGCIPRLIEVSHDAGSMLLSSLQCRSSPEVQMALAAILPSLLRNSHPEALRLLDALSISDRVDARAAAVSSLKGLSGIDEEEFLSRLQHFAADEDVSIRRQFVQCCLRDYLELDRIDSAEIFTPLWHEMDEVAGVRMRELMMRMQSVDPQSFSTIAKKLTAQSGDSLAVLWSVMGVRDEERVNVWKTHLEEDGPLPEPLH